MLWTLRLVTAGDIQKPVSMRDTHFPTKRECHRAITALGELSTISRFGRTYVVTPKKK